MKMHDRLNQALAVLTLLLGAAFFGSQALAQEAPDALVERLSQEVLDILKSDKDLQAGNARRVREVVESKILPHVDFRKTTALTAGRFWREATPEQQQRLTDEFRDLLIYTYSGALSQVRDQRLEFRPLRAAPADAQVVVHSQVIQSGREPAQLDYRLEKTPGGWKIYDINVLGAWLTATYKSSFEAEVNRGGIDGLIRVLAEKNRQLASNAGPTSKDGR